MSNSFHVSDSGILPDCLDGSLGLIDWSEQLERHRGWLHKVLRCRIGDDSAVEDCLQEIALAVVKQNNKPADEEKIPSWLYRLAIRQAVNFHRRNGRQRNMVERYQAAMDHRRECGVDPLIWLMNCEQQDLIRQAVQSLRPGDREILMLKYTEHWSYRQLAEHLGIGFDTVEYRLVRAKKSLRQLLNRVVQGEVVT